MNEVNYSPLWSWLFKGKDTMLRDSLCALLVIEILRNLSINTWHFQRRDQKWFVEFHTRRLLRSHNNAMTLSRMLRTKDLEMLKIKDFCSFILVFQIGIEEPLNISLFNIFFMRSKNKITLTTETSLLLTIVWIMVLAWRRFIQLIISIYLTITT